MTNSYWNYNQNELYHHGIMGQKWGVRRFQNEDGSLTAAGRARLRKTSKYAAQNVKLEKKVGSLDKRASEARANVEKIHAKYDLNGTTKYIKKAAKLEKKAGKYDKKASRENDAANKARLEAKAQAYRYAEATQKSRADRAAKQSGFGVKAMKAQMKADQIELKAEKARLKLMNNEAYIAFTKKELGSVDDYYKKGKTMLKS